MTEVCWAAGGLSYLALHITASQGNHTAETCILDKSAVVHQLCGGEGCHGVKETSGSLAEVSDGHGIETLVRLEAVPAVPVPALFHQPTGGCIVIITTLRVM